MPIRGGKDAHFNDGTVIEGAFEGFPRWPTTAPKCRDSSELLRLG